MISQKTEDLVGPYELHDFFMYYILRYGYRPSRIFRLAETAFAGIYDSAVILKWLKTFYRRFFSQQFKRDVYKRQLKDPHGPGNGGHVFLLQCPGDHGRTLGQQLSGPGP